MAHKHRSRSEDRATHSAGGEGTEEQSNEQETAGQSPPARTADGQTDTMKRAEEMVDWLGDRARHYTSVAGYYVLWAASRVREEAEDIWAEAQTMRRKPQS